MSTLTPSSRPAGVPAPHFIAPGEATSSAPDGPAPARPVPSASSLPAPGSSPEPVLITGSLFLVGEATVALGLAEPTAEASEQ